MFVRTSTSAIDTLEGVIRACPDAHWAVGKPQRQPWYLAFHTLFWLDLHLSEQAESYRPPKPFTLGELQPDVFPDKPYRKGLLLYNMRHVQHHAAQLNYLIRDAAAEPASWVMRADGLPEDPN